MNFTCLTDSKRNSFIGNARRWTWGYTHTNLKTLKRASFASQTAVAHQLLCLGLSEGLRASGRCEKWCFSHLFSSCAPWRKLVPKPSPAKAQRWKGGQPGWEKAEQAFTGKNRTSNKMRSPTPLSTRDVPVPKGHRDYAGMWCPFPDLLVQDR